MGRLGSFRPTAAADGLGHGGHSLVLPHHPLMQSLLQLQQALALVLGETGDGDTGQPATTLAMSSSVTVPRLVDICLCHLSRSISTCS